MRRAAATRPRPSNDIRAGSGTFDVSSWDVSSSDVSSVDVSSPGNSNEPALVWNFTAKSVNSHSAVLLAGFQLIVSTNTSVSPFCSPSFTLPPGQLFAGNAQISTRDCDGMPGVPGPLPTT